MAKTLMRRVLDRLETYVPGKSVEEVQRDLGLGEIVKLASNENPWGPSPKAMEAIRSELAMTHHYPEGSCRELRVALAARHGIGEEMVTVSNGADNILMMIAQAFVEAGDEVILARPTFPVYRTATLLMNGVPIEIPLKEYVHDLEAMAEAVGSRTKAVVVCNPNNPTGTMVARNDMARFLERLPRNILLVMDEVYGDFASPRDLPDTLGLIMDGRPVISVRSFSKLYGLAGLRVGYALAPPELIQALNRVREPFPVNRLAQAAAIAALEDEPFRDRVLRENEAGKTFLTNAFQDMGLRCLSSQTNFLFVDLGTDAQTIFEALLQRGVIIRPGTIWGTPTCCRITVGTPQQNKKLVDALKEVLG